MAAGRVATPLTLEKFEQLYGDEKPYYEYWDGEAIPKPMPTILHFLLQAILIRIFHQIGLVSGGEVRLKLSQTKQPLPDGIAGSRLQHPYPTKPFEVVVEILSPDDRKQRVLRKCRFYAEAGIGYVLYSIRRTGLQSDGIQPSAPLSRWRRLKLRLVRQFRSAEFGLNLSGSWSGWTGVANTPSTVQKLIGPGYRFIVRSS